MQLPRGFARKLSRGAVGILPTDTIYGIVGSALRRSAVERIYRLRTRSPKKPCIILVASAKELRRFGVRVALPARRFLKAWWPGKVSVVFPVPKGTFAYLHRGTETLAFRVPKPRVLRSLLRRSGPLVAPSANPEGKPPAKSLREARRYFGNAVDFYIFGVQKRGRPSTLVSFQGGRIRVLRAGAVRIPGQFACLTKLT